MKASLDTNIIIHFYRANKQDILFEIFSEGVVIYEQIRKVELQNHAGMLLETIDADIEKEKIVKYTDFKLKELGIKKIFDENVKDNKMLYGAGDMGEVYAISLAQTIGVYSLVTDDIKQGGPYMSLLQLKYDDVIPFNFVDVLIIRFLIGKVDAQKTVDDFNEINDASSLNWNFESNIKKFLKRFFGNDTYKKEDTEFIKKLVDKYQIEVKSKFQELRRIIKEHSKSESAKEKST